MKHLAVFTSTRADLGPLMPVIMEIDAASDLRLTLIATGTHLDKTLGGTLDDVHLASRNSHIVTIPTKVDRTEPHELAKAFAAIATGVSRVLLDRQPDWLVLLGDRWELLGAATPALLHGVSIAHIHGGETTKGAIDDRIRHGLTKLADLHLCATIQSARTIRSLGEESWRIVVTGAPGLDRLSNVCPLMDDEIAKLLGVERIARPLAIVVYHPETVDRTAVAIRTQAVLSACAETLGTVIVLSPGADPGGLEVRSAIRDAGNKYINMHSIQNLGERYIELMAAADVLVGNSSSGIIEAATFGLPVVNVGRRQSGRERGQNVIDVPASGDIEQALRRALSPGFRTSFADMGNVYGDGTAAEKILAALRGFETQRRPRSTSACTVIDVNELAVREGGSIYDAMAAIDRGRSGIALVLDDDGRLLGTVTDGDVRRALMSGATLSDPLKCSMSAMPVQGLLDDDDDDILAIMYRSFVLQVPVVDSTGRVVALKSFRDLLVGVPR